jgi:hypothetical protein
LAIVVSALNGRADSIDAHALAPELRSKELVVSQGDINNSLLRIAALREDELTTEDDEEITIEAVLPSGRIKVFLTRVDQPYGRLNARGRSGYSSGRTRLKRPTKFFGNESVAADTGFPKYDEETHRTANQGTCEPNNCRKP